MGFVQDVIEPGATVITDAWPTYRNVVRLGYGHVAHNISRSGKQAHELLPGCHRVSALLKRWLLGTHQGSVKPEHLDYYLDEFTFRFNRRYSNHRGLLFYRLLDQAAETAPQPHTGVLSPAVGLRRRRCQARARQRRSEGLVAERVERPRSRAKRPGGARTRLGDAASPPAQHDGRWPPRHRCAPPRLIRETAPGIADAKGRARATRECWRARPEGVTSRGASARYECGSGLGRRA
jgi:hypothetical protein